MTICTDLNITSFHVISSKTQALSAHLTNATTPVWLGYTDLLRDGHSGDLAKVHLPPLSAQRCYTWWPRLATTAGSNCIIEWCRPFSERINLRNEVICELVHVLQVALGELPLSEQVSVSMFYSRRGESDVSPFGLSGVFLLDVARKRRLLLEESPRTSCPVLGIF